MAIVIFEGPAGAGKSTCIKAMREELGEFSKIAETGLPRPRQYAEADKGAHRSLQKDMAAILNAVGLMKRHPQDTIILDRCIASQRVYLNRRGGVAFYSGIDAEFKSLWRAIRGSTLSRTDLNFPLQLPIEPDVVWVVVHPPFNELIRRREMAQRDFPYSPYAEGLAYGQVGQALLREDAHVLFIEDVAEIPEIVRQVTR